ncbi:craniofacial development protein 2-like [Cylas formicarius]|uniref:craniofacial development protein 2-like n=1 Tax=Cylas formicarius TaxID=197179 RepID=UPI002958DDFF|nr:craniofacial development protein 2-like [Cylas formicarius]
MDVVALQEIRWPEESTQTMGKYTIFNGGTRDNKHEFGTGFAVSGEILGQVMNFRAVNNRISTLRIRDRWYNYTLISTHAPTEDKDEEVKDEYYEQLEQTISAVPKQDMLIILGDLNAKVGREEAFRPHIGRHSLHELSNDNGQRLINLAAANNLRIASTMFPHKNIHKETWISNDRKTRNQIDHVIANARHVRSIIDVKSQRGADAGTDHFLVRVKVRSRIKKTITSQETSALKRWNTDKLNQDETCRHEYQKELETQLQKNVTQEASDVEEHWKQIRTSVINAAQRALGENTKNRRRKDWYDKESQKALDTKNKARIQMLQCPSDENVQRFNDLRAEAKRKIRRKKREAYNKTIENVEKEAGLTNSRNFFNQVKSIRKGDTPKTNILTSS